MEQRSEGMNKPQIRKLFTQIVITFCIFSFVLTMLMGLSIFNPKKLLQKELEELLNPYRYIEVDTLISKGYVVKFIRGKDVEKRLELSIEYDGDYIVKIPKLYLSPNKTKIAVSWMAIASDAHYNVATDERALIVETLKGKCRILNINVFDEYGNNLYIIDTEKDRLNRQPQHSTFNNTEYEYNEPYLFIKLLDNFGNLWFSNSNGQIIKSIKSDKVIDYNDLNTLTDYQGKTLMTISKESFFIMRLVSSDTSNCRKKIAVTRISLLNGNIFQSKVIEMNEKCQTAYFKSELISLENDELALLYENNKRFGGKRYMLVGILFQKYNRELTKFEEKYYDFDVLEYFILGVGDDVLFCKWDKKGIESIFVFSEKKVEISENALEKLIRIKENGYQSIRKEIFEVLLSN